MQRLSSFGSQFRAVFAKSSAFPLSAPSLSNNVAMSFFNVPVRNFGLQKQVTFPKWRIVRGDRVGIIAGKDKGKQGTVLRVYRKKNQVLISGINQKIKRVKADMEKDQKGGVKSIIHPVHVSNVQLVDPESGKTTKTRFGYLATGEKVRISKSTGTIIPKQMLAVYNQKNRNKNKVDGPKDTTGATALEVTYRGEDFDKIKAEFEDFIKEKERKEKLLVFRD